MPALPSRGRRPPVLRTLDFALPGDAGNPMRRPPFSRLAERRGAFPRAQAALRDCGEALNRNLRDERAIFRPLCIKPVRSPFAIVASRERWGAPSATAPDKNDRAQPKGILGLDPAYPGVRGVGADGFGALHLVLRPRKGHRPNPHSVVPTLACQHLDSPLRMRSPRHNRN